MRATKLSVGVKHWVAWAPGLDSMESWRCWAQGLLTVDARSEAAPELKFLPAMLRRRLSRLSKMALQVAYACNPEGSIRTVFASRHGDLKTTCELLETLARCEPLSPTAFSMSVHNTASGYYSIARADRSPSIALASGEDSLESGFLDAAAVLCAGRAAQVLLIYVEDVLPEFFQPYCEEPVFPHAVAFLLSADVGQGQWLALELLPPMLTVDVSVSHALEVLRMLILGKSQQVLGTSRVNWRWSSDGRAD